jgi:hypothetical protein
MFRQFYFPTILSCLALVAALAALVGNGAQPATATTLLGSIGPQAATGTGFTYQGYLTRNGAPINGAGQCDMRFSLWDTANGGAQVGNLQLVGAVDFANGAFTVTLNDSSQFGADAFAGAARWLQVELACPSGSASFSTVGRQAITAVPYATYSQSTGALQGRPLSAAAPSSGQMLRWDGSAWAPANAYARTILVSPLGTPAQSGAALLAALAAIADVSANTPYLLKIEPGVYDLGTTSLQMKPYVDIEGSGQGVTKILGSRKANYGEGALYGASNAELRQLTVSVTSGSGRYASAIVNSGAAPRIVFVTAQGDGDESYGVLNINGAAPRLEHVTALASGLGFSTGVSMDRNTTAVLIDVTVRSTGSGTNFGVFATGNIDNTQGGRPYILGGLIEVSGGATDNSGIWSQSGAVVTVQHTRVASSGVGADAFVGGSIRIGASQLDAPTPGANQSGILTCAGAYNGNFAPLNTNCQ